ncbi:MAG: Fic family protein [Nanoarchaeota archaeon]|nr:Fic family protein [Nanoarchaeota archaeon]
MVSEFDVFYIIATKGELKIVDIVDALNKETEEYQNIFNNVIKLEKQGYVKRNGTVKIVHSKKSVSLFNLISFCMNNGLNYNLLFKKSMLEFLNIVKRKEFFTINDANIHAATFKSYVELLNRYGFLLIVSRKPLKCKLLRNHFLIDLLRFFGYSIEFYTPKNSSMIKQITKEFKTYKRRQREGYTVRKDLENIREASFIHTSLSLEGNPITLPETQKLILDEIVPEKYKLSQIEEVTNYKKAIDLMIENAKRKIKLTLPLILDYHRLAMAAIKEAGKTRAQNVIIKNNPNFRTSDWQDIPEKLADLLGEYNNYMKKKKDMEEVIKFASYFHNEFQRIHPFIDGNSRISRLLLFYILRGEGIPVLELPLGYFDIYLDFTKRSVKRDDDSFRYLIEEIIFMNLKGVNSAYL